MGNPIEIAENGNSMELASSMTEIMKILLGDYSEENLGRLIELSSKVQEIQRDNGNGSIDRLAKGSFRAILPDWILHTLENPFFCVLDNGAYSLWTNYNSSLALEIRYKHPIDQALKCIRLKEYGPESRDGTITNFYTKNGKIGDIYGLRFIVDDSSTVVKGIFGKVVKFLEGEEVKDYSHNPKLNGYDALHASGVPKCSINRGKPILSEIQFRTWLLHLFAELGEGNHKDYKKRKNGQLPANTIFLEKCGFPHETPLSEFLKTYYTYDSIQGVSFRDIISDFVRYQNIEGQGKIQMIH